MMKTVSRAYAALIDGLAVIAAAMLGLITLLIVVDVLMRNLGLQPYPHTLSLTEYSLLYITMLGTPWLVRKKGHVHIEMVVARLPARTRRIVHGFVCLVCMAVCAVLAWYSLEVTLANAARGDLDIRSFDSPRWILVACMPLGFGLMVIEFGRFLFGHDNLFDGATAFE